MAGATKVAMAARAMPHMRMVVPMAAAIPRIDVTMAVVMAVVVSTATAVTVVMFGMLVLVLVLFLFVLRLGGWSEHEGRNHNCYSQRQPRHGREKMEIHIVPL